MQSRRYFFKWAGGGAAVLVLAGATSLVRAEAAQKPKIMVYKSPTCGCCTGWAAHLRENGFDVSVENRDDLPSIKARQGVPEDLQSCHTAVVDGYTIEGHVPAGDIKKLLAQKPDAQGLAAPGMPMGSPGMEMGGRKDSYRVILFNKTGRAIFARH
jgi:hypothetical protein